MSKTMKFMEVGSEACLNDIKDDGNDCSTVVVRNNRISAIVLPVSIFPKGTLNSDISPLLPGENTISKQVWEKAKQNPGIQLYRESGILVYLRKGEAFRDNLNWDKVSPGEALPVIARIKDVQKLNDVRQKAIGNDHVVQLCTERIAELLDKEQS